MLVLNERMWFTPRETNRWLESMKPSTFSRMAASSRRSDVSSSASSGTCRKTKSGSSGRFWSRALTNCTSSVVLLSTGWQEPQVRPLPSNVSWKKTPAPAQMSWETSPATTRGSSAHSASRSTR